MLLRVGERAMRCTTCGMTVKGKAIREEIAGKVRYYCCASCLEEELCRRDKPLQKAFGRQSRRARGLRARHHRA